MIPFIDLKKQYNAYKSEIDSAIQSVVEQTAFIGGQAIGQLEEDLSNFCKVPHSIACSSGTDALQLALMALKIGPGDEVIVPDFTFFATAEAVCLVGATPVFADIDPFHYNISVDHAQSLITPRTRAVIAVSMFGQCPDFQALLQLCNHHSITLIEDGAQSFGALYHQKRSCSIAPISTTSFFPAKPLGCFGDGGAVFTTDPSIAKAIRCILNHGQEGRYHHVRIGLNARLDTIQAAVLRVKLKYFQQELDQRNLVAQTYSLALKDSGLILPQVQTGLVSSWAQYTVRHTQRDLICQNLQGHGIPTAVHYPTPLHTQPALAHLQSAKQARCPNAQAVASEVFSLPMHGFLSAEEARGIGERVKVLL